MNPSSRPEAPPPGSYRDLVRTALAEDVGGGDVTTAAIVPPGTPARGVFLAKSPCVLAGLPVAREVFAEADPAIRWNALKSDGDRCTPGDRIAEIDGPAAGVLRAERTALNFLQHLSGIATLTRAFVDVAGRLQVLDTRKTIPGLRHLAKYAVRCGGGGNYRVGLFDGVLIKDNHIRVAGSIAEAVRRVRAAGVALPIEVEAQSLAEVEQALSARADVIMLDNLDASETAAAVRLIAKRARVELSGRMTLERVRSAAESGADCVSIGALTHSAPAADISLEIETGVQPAAR